MLQIGYDLYRIEECYLLYLLKYSRLHHMQISHLRHDENHYIFYIPTYQRYYLHHFEYPVVYLKTIGFIKYCLYVFHNYLNVMGVLCFLVAVIGSSYFIYDIQIIGTMPQVNQQMLNDLKKEKVDYFHPLKSYERLNDILIDFKSLYKNKVEYLNIYQIGSVFHIEYTKRKQDHLAEDDFRNLYAKKDGMIAYFMVDSGLIKVKKNDYVKKGDLLVDNTIISTQNQTHIIPVKGEVYAYTFNQYEASVANHNQDQGEVFYQLLLDIRSKLPTQAMIDKENVLQITRTRSKITLKMHYTLIENIAFKGETDERSH